MRRSKKCVIALVAAATRAKVLIMYVLALLVFEILIKYEAL